MNIQELFDKTIANHASDLHLVAGVAPVIRVDGKLLALASYNPLTAEETQDLTFSILTPAQKEMFLTNRSIDFSYGYGQEGTANSGRFRINLYFQKDTVSGAFRLLPSEAKTIDDLHLPQICHTFAKSKQGFVLVTGPTGHGKSTTLAAIINEINTNQSMNILTIEDPVEYIYPKGASIVSQREIGTDSLSWTEALRSALREDPDVVLIGEMRDTESIGSAITMAETGHLVFSTLHTNSAAQTVDRMIDSFSEGQQGQIRAQLANSLAGVISQRLIPKLDGGRVVACEVLVANNAVRSNIREGKTHLIDSIIETSQGDGMFSLEASLAGLVKQGIISLEVGRNYAQRLDSFNQLVS